jgi:hypothetical protein
MRVKDQPYVGLGTASRILGRGGAVVLRLALVGDISYRVTDDGRSLFSVESLHAVKAKLAEQANKAEPVGV